MFAFSALKQIGLRMSHLETVVLAFTLVFVLLADAELMFDDAFIVKPGGQVHTVERKIVSKMVVLHYTLKSFYFV